MARTRSHVLAFASLEAAANLHPAQLVAILNPMCLFLLGRVPSSGSGLATGAVCVAVGHLGRGHPGTLAAWGILALSCQDALPVRRPPRHPQCRGQPVRLVPVGGADRRSHRHPRSGSPAGAVAVRSELRIGSAAGPSLAHRDGQGHKQDPERRCGRSPMTDRAARFGGSARRPFRARSWTSGDPANARDTRASQAASLNRSGLASAPRSCRG